MHREFKGVWIPREIYLNPELSTTEKLLITEIDSLSRLKDGCFASNEHFAEFLQISVKTVANLMRSLQIKGLVEISGRGSTRTIKIIPGVFPEIGKTNLSRNRENLSRNRENDSPLYRNNNTKINSVINKGSRISESFQPTEEMLEWARARFPGIQLEVETEKFINYWVSVSGSKGIKRNWEATWRNWIINANTYLEKNNVKTTIAGSRPTPEDTISRAKELIRLKYS